MVNKRKEKDLQVTYRLPAWVVMVNILLYTPCHALVTALRAKYLYSPSSNDWERLVPASVVSCANHLDKNLQKTFPLFYCVAVGQRQLVCLLKQTTSPCYKLFRDAFVILITLLRSSPDKYRADMDVLLALAPSFRQFSLVPELEPVMSFIERFHITTHFTLELPSISPIHTAICLAVGVYEYIAPHESDNCPSYLERCDLHDNRHQGCLPPQNSSSSSRTVSSSSENSPLNVSSSSSNSQTLVQSQGNHFVVARHNSGTFCPSPFEVDLSAYIDSCYELGEESYSFEHFIRTGEYKTAHENLVRHNPTSFCDVYLWSRIIYDLAELDRKYQQTHSNVNGTNCNLLSGLMMIFRASITSLDTSIPHQSVAYFLDSRLRVNPSEITASTSMIDIRNRTTPRCGSGSGMPISFVPPTHDCSKSYRFLIPPSQHNYTLRGESDIIRDKNKKRCVDYRLKQKKAKSQPDRETKDNSCSSLSSSSSSSTTTTTTTTATTTIAPLNGRTPSRRVAGLLPENNGLTRTQAASYVTTHFPRSPFETFIEDDDDDTFPDRFDFSALDDSNPFSNLSRPNSEDDSNL